MKKVALIGISLIFVYYLFFYKKKVEIKDKVIVEPKNVKEPTENDVIGQKYQLIEEYKGGKQVYLAGSIFRKRTENNKVGNSYMLEYNNNLNMFDVIPISVLNRV
jgi:hypothetical protein